MLLSIKGGMFQLVDRLADGIGHENILTNTPVTKIDMVKTYFITF